MLSPVKLATATTGWHAELDLRYASCGDRTRLIKRAHRGPLLVQRPFYPEGAICHNYILHPPGGLVGGDELVLDVHCENESHALLTTPAATKFYRSDARTARQQQTLCVAAGAALEWLPQEAIWFSGAHAYVTTRIEVEQDARFIGWESLCLGRPQSQERFNQGMAQLCLELWRDGRPLLIEQLRCPGDGAMLDSHWGLHGHAFAATLVAINAGEQEQDKLRQLATLTPGSWGVTLLDDVLIGRYLGDSADDMHQVLISAWQRLRPTLMGRTACPPRIWST